MKYKSVIFDLDGVICHTDRFHYSAWKKLADELSIYFDEEINNKLRGVSRNESLSIILQKHEGKPFSSAEKAALADKKNENYKLLLQQMSKSDLSSEVFNTLEKLRGMGLLLAIGSSSKNARLILHQIGLDNYFDAVSDGNNIVNSKPHPEVFLKAAEMLCIEPEACIVVEDAKAGLEAAKAANMTSAAIGDAVSCNMADYNLNCFSELADILKST